MTIIWCMVPEIWSVTDQIFCHSGMLFVLLPPYGPRKSKFWKNEKKARRYYHFTQVYHKWQSYYVWFLRYEAWLTIFLPFWTVFCSTTPLTTRKTKILKNWKKKKSGDIIILHKCTKNNDPMLYCSLDNGFLRYDRWLLILFIILDRFFALLPP